MIVTLAGLFGGVLEGSKDKRRLLRLLVQFELDEFQESGIFLENE
jgi:hypothetical protein